MEHLILPTEDAPAKGRLAVALSALLTLAVLVGSPVTDLLDPAQERRPMGVELQQLQALERNASPWDGTLAKLVERKLGQRSRTRSLLGPYAAAVQLKLGRSARGKGVLVGDEGWMFASERALPAPETAAIAAIEGVEFLRAMQERLAFHDVRTVFVLVPRKVTIAGAALAKGDVTAPAFDDEVVEHATDVGLDFVDMLGAMRQESPARWFLKEDTHWTDAASETAAVLVAERLQLEPDPVALVEIEVQTHPRGGDLRRIYGVDPWHPTDAWFESPPHERLIASRVMDLPAPKPRVALIGTSYGAGFALAQRLTRSLGTVTAPFAEAGKFFLMTLKDLLPRIENADHLEVLVIEIPTYQMVDSASDNINFETMYGDLVHAMPRGEWRPIGEETCTAGVAPSLQTIYAAGTLGADRSGQWWVEITARSNQGREDTGTGGGGNWFVGTGRLGMRVSPKLGTPFYVPVLGDGELRVQSMHVHPDVELVIRPVELIRP